MRTIVLYGLLLAVPVANLKAIPAPAKTSLPEATAEQLIAAKQM